MNQFEKFYSQKIVSYILTIVLVFISGVLILNAETGMKVMAKNADTLVGEVLN